ncbi:MAG: bifunctional alpha,alpha-trehalose-phosphate synthase (UDP-forming)/trehalose-phosphatase [Candidatus Altiarchaeota archaeon]|nr:bifunctional alpha,alpha-trehalose-phosphate synthase (UDP-forming)/trehalose-phosphatase [Candidatus Altiarchaeota archaeon]
MRLLVVSNRLPCTISEKEGRTVFTESAGGLVSGLSACLKHFRDSSPGNEYVWIGWPGIAVKEGCREDVRKKALEKHSSYPVYLPEKDSKRFYEGFCNKTIWPLFHCFPTYTAYDNGCWQSYKQVNGLFCDTVTEMAKPGDVIWIHDYHLMLLPKMLRERMPDAKIGFFLHIPFPEYEIFRLLPGRWRNGILEGLLGADLIGFHTQDYTQYFLRSVLRILGLDHDMGGIAAGDRVVKAETFPMGIDYGKFNEAIENPSVRKEREKLRKALADRRIILSVDRLDYSKGIINRLKGYELFLEENPEWHRKVILSLVVVPSRSGVEHYRRMKREIDETVGKINGRFGGIDWTPIAYRYAFLPYDQLAALYDASDVALVTPLRDGMNLIAKEYVASRRKGKGVLILSEMTGAAKELGEAVLINPNDIGEIAGALKEALGMPTEEQIRRNTAMQKRLEASDIRKWYQSFLSGLSAIKEEQEGMKARMLCAKAKSGQIKDYAGSEKRLILLDYDGVLAPFSADPKDAKPDREVLDIIKKLSKNPKTDVVIISGRDKDTLTEWFGIQDIGLVAEHGVWTREPDGGWVLSRSLDSEWKSRLSEMFQRYVERVPGSFVEEKDHSLVWHYRKADPKPASMKAKELTDNLVNLTASMDLQVLQGSKVVEVRNAGVNKGSAALHLISKNTYDYILAVGDDRTDEDMFKALPDTACTIRVGLNPSHARFNLRSCREVRRLLEDLSRTG